MIPWDDNAEGMREFTKPVIKIEKLLGAHTVHREVPGMNEQVTTRNVNGFVQLVRVRDQNDRKATRALLCGGEPFWQAHTRFALLTSLHRPSRHSAERHLAG
jgi:hypothetical protein